MPTSPPDRVLDTLPVLVLASASPRRSDLLARLLVPFTVKPSEIDETLATTLPISEAVAELAERKARAVAAELSGRVVLGADTIVLLEDRVFGKPVDAADAQRMLRALSGRWHEVKTGIALVDTWSGRSERSVVTSRIKMRELTDAEIATYSASGEPMDKAGSYAIQGAASAFIAETDGCYTNIVGLPLCETASMLERWGFACVTSAPPCSSPTGERCQRLRPWCRGPV